MHAPRAAKTNVCMIKTAINLHSHRSMHLQWYQRRWLTPPMNVRLITRDVWIVHQLRLRNHRISHHRSRQVTLRQLRWLRRHRPRHRCRCRRGHFLSVVNSLRKTQSVLHTCCELSRHVEKIFPAKKIDGAVSYVMYVKVSFPFEMQLLSEREGEKELKKKTMRWYGLFWKLIFGQC